MKFQSKLSHFHWKTFIWKCRSQNTGHFVKASVYHYQLSSQQIASYTSHLASVTVWNTTLETCIVFYFHRDKIYMDVTLYSRACPVIDHKAIKRCFKEKILQAYSLPELTLLGPGSEYPRRTKAIWMLIVAIDAQTPCVASCPFY